ncbi:MAG TPA: hypothetical protein DCM87_22245 [Planctomycetes bacterium]|nr:hypothetical protein [Planctomycetota bacterium]
MSNASVEALKQMSLVDFLSRQYGLEFQRCGTEYRCRSPFSTDTKPSFFVRLVQGHWLFKDFSSGEGGSVFDFVRLKEKLPSFAEAFAFVRSAVKSLAPSFHHADQRADGVAGARADGEARHDVDSLYERFRRNDPGVCREYLLGRGITAALVDALIAKGTVVHNRLGGSSYCCFAVRDQDGTLRCLDNHAIEGTKKFVLGSKAPFSCEWEAVTRAKAVFLTEGILDYLSIKSLELEPLPGLALLGNQLNFERELLGNAERIVSAMDNDTGGNSAFLDLVDRYGDKEVHAYDLEGHKDPNELLVAVRSGKGRRLSAKRRLQLYREFQRVENKAELARHWGIDRSYLYEVVRDAEETLLASMEERKVGRPPKGTPTTLAEAQERIRELERQYEKEATERERLYCRTELMAIRLKWAEIDAAEARGEKVNEETGPEAKRQIKKKKNGRPS